LDDKILVGGKINNLEHKLAKADKNNYEDSAQSSTHLRKIFSCQQKTKRKKT
jgi:hypothetical protein